IALPFQFHPRKLGHSLFVDSRFEALPWEHQWQFLAGIERLEGDRVRALAKEAVRTRRVLGVPQPPPDDEDDDTPWKPTRTRTLLAVNASRLVCDDQRDRGKSVALTFQGTLIPEQEAAVRAMLPHDLGVLVAPPGAGKTVMGASMVAARGVNTLVLVHRRPLL